MRSTSTGAVVATAMTPDLPGCQLAAQSMAAAPDGRTFYVEYNA